MLKLLSLNIEGEKHIDTVISFIQSEKPDIVCFQELFLKDVHVFEKRLNMKSTFCPMAMFPFDFEWNKEHKKNEFGTIGLAIFTKLKTEYTQSRYYASVGTYFPYYQNPGQPINRALLFTKVKKEDEKYTIATTHFTWTPDGKANDKQKKDVARMQTILNKKVKEFVLCGDFNAPRGGKIWSQLDELYTDNIPQKVETTLDPKLHYAASTKNIRFVVDGMFSTPEYIVNNVKVVCGVSDHCAVVGEVEEVK